MSILQMGKHGVVKDPLPSSCILLGGGGVGFEPKKCASGVSGMNAERPHWSVKLPHLSSSRDSCTKPGTS